MTAQRKTPGAARWEALAARWARHGTLVPLRAARDAVALGVQLLMLKDAAAHGTWRNSVNAMGMDAHTASRYMAVARRFADAPDAFFDAIGSVTKMVELLPLADTDALARGEAVLGLTLEAITLMTARELRTAVRAARAEVGPQQPVAQPKPNHQPLEEERLLRLFRQCNAPFRDFLMWTMQQMIARECSIQAANQKR